MKKLINKIKNKIFKKKNKDNKNSSEETKAPGLPKIVFFDIKMSDLSGNHKCTDCGSFYCSNPKKEPRITFIQAGGLADQILEIDDLICKINGTSIKMVADFDNERKKLKWGQKVDFVIERKGKVLTKSIIPISHEDSLNRQMLPYIDVDVNNKKEVFIKNIQGRLSKDGLGVFEDLKEEDVILSFNSKKIKLIQDWFGELSKVKPGKKIHLEIKRNSKSFRTVVETFGFSEYLIRYRKLAQALFKNNQTKTDLFMKEFTENGYQSLPIKRIEEIQNMDLEEKSKHEVRFNFFFRDKNNKIVMRDVEDSHDTKPRIKGVQNASESHGHLEINDLILSINGNPTKTISDYIKEKRKLQWGQEVTFEIERKGKILKKYITPISFESWKEKMVSLGIDVLTHKKKYIKVSNIQFLLSARPKFDSPTLIVEGDIIISVNSKKIGSIEDWDREISRFKPGQTITFKVKRKMKGIISEKITLINFNDFLKNNEEHVRKYNSKKVADLMLKEYEEGDYMGISDERRQEIQNMDSEEEQNNYTDDDYSHDEEKIYLSTSVKKEKVAGKESFALTLDSFPDDERLETLTDGKKIFLKIYVFDVTDLDSDKYYEISDTTGLTDQYFSNNCHVIKTNEITWSDGNMNLIQSKELEPYGDHPTKLAFPYSVMLLPKVGKRKLSFRTFLCTDKQKFDDVEGRPKDGESINYRPESFKMDDYAEYGFDDYGDYPEILSYTSSEIEVEYKQPGYLDINRRKYNDLIIALSLALSQLKSKKFEENLETIKDSIMYDGDYSVEGSVYKTLNLKSNYENALKKKIDLEPILKELKKNSRIHERYEMIDRLLNLAIKDESYTEKENEFIDKVAKNLDLNNEKFQEIKKQKTASVKFVDFGGKADESIFGITKDMDKKGKLRVLRKEYSRWNALTNNNDKAIRERAREMRDLAANIRKQLT